MIRTESTIRKRNSSRADILLDQLLKALDEKERIIIKIDEVFNSFQDREEADRIISKRWSEKMGKAVERVDELTASWIRSMELEVQIF